MRPEYKYTLSIALLLSTLNLCHAKALNNTINATINALNPAIQTSLWIATLNRNKTKLIYQKNSKQLMTPASLTKLITAALAFQYLGENYHFTTDMTLYGNRKGSQFKGTIVIKGHGDPTFTAQTIKTMVKTLKINHINQIDGNIAIDQSAFDQTPYGPGWMWDEIHEGYATNINSLIVNHNRIKLNVKPSNVLNKIATLQYDWAPFPITNTIATAGKQTDSPCDIHIDAQHRLTGCIPQKSNKIVEVAAPPCPLFKHYFTKEARAQQLTLHVNWKKMPPNNTKAAYATFKFSSPPLIHILNKMLEKSDNLIAEVLFKTLGKQFFHTPGTWTKGQDFAHAILSNWPQMQTLTMVDGSGLSRYNAISAGQIGKILALMHRNDKMKYLLLHHLPQAQAPSMITKISAALLPNDPKKKHVLQYWMPNSMQPIYAKTGSMQGVYNLAGIVNPYNAHPILFVLMFNHIPPSQHQKVITNIAHILTALSGHHS